METDWRQSAYESQLTNLSKRPIEVRNGSSTVKIYEGTNHVQGSAYTQYTLAYYLGNRRVKRKFADLKEARRKAEVVAAKLAHRENEVLRLTTADRLVYVQAQEDLRPLIAVGEYVNAVKRLPPGVDLSEVEPFQKNCSRAVVEHERAVFWSFRFVSAQLSRLVGIFQTCTFAEGR